MLACLYLPEVFRRLALKLARRMRGGIDALPPRMAAWAPNITAGGRPPRQLLATPGMPRGMQRTGNDMTKRILIADDELPIATLLTESLAQEGYETFTNTQSLRFFDAVREHLPHLVLLDFMMPYLDGRDELQLMRMTPETADIPVIIVTAYGEVKQQEEELRKLGVIEIVLKPFDLDSLMGLVKRTIGEPREAQGVSR